MAVYKCLYCEQSFADTTTLSGGQHSDGYAALEAHAVRVHGLKPAPESTKPEPADSIPLFDRDEYLR